MEDKGSNISHITGCFQLTQHGLQTQRLKAPSTDNTTATEEGNLVTNYATIRRKDEDYERVDHASPAW